MSGSICQPVGPSVGDGKFWHEVRAGTTDQQHLKFVGGSGWHCLSQTTTCTTPDVLLDLRKAARLERLVFFPNVWYVSCVVGVGFFISADA